MPTGTPSCNATVLPLAMIHTLSVAAPGKSNKGPLVDAGEGPVTALSRPSSLVSSLSRDHGQHVRSNSRPSGSPSPCQKTKASQQEMGESSDPRERDSLTIEKERRVKKEKAGEKKKTPVGSGRARVAMGK